MKKYCLLFFVLALISSRQVYAQVKGDSDEEVQAADSLVSTKEEKNRNVMLNATSSASPREVNVGLPFTGDLVIAENNVPVVYNFYPTNPMNAWRMDNSLGRMGLLSFEEGALLYGKVGFVVDSYDRDFSRKFQVLASTYINSFGSSRFDMTLTGPLGKGWGYMLSFCKEFEKGNGTNYMFTDWGGESLFLKGAIQKKYSKGKVKFLFKYADAKMVYGGYYPVYYLGDGNTKVVEGFDLGTDSYLPRSGLVPYFDVDGNIGIADLSEDKFSRSQSYNFYIDGDHRFDNGWKLKYSALYQKMNSPMPVQFPYSIGIYENDGSFVNSYTYQGTDIPYEGKYAQMMVNQIIPQSDCAMASARVEVTKKINTHDLRGGMAYQMFDRDYEVYAGSFFQSVEPNPYILDRPAYGTQYFNGLIGQSYGNKYHDKFNKLALYVSDDFQVNAKLGLSLGARIEHQTITEWLNPYINNEPLGDKSLIKHTWKNKFNKVAYGKFVYKLTRTFGLLGDASYNSDNQNYWDYEFRSPEGYPLDENGLTSATGHPRTTVPKMFETYVTKFSGGIYLNIGKELNLVSKVTSISKNNVRSFETTISDPTNPAFRADFGPEFYDIQTLGWTTDIVSNPLGNFNIHFLLTIQDPRFRNYEISGFGQTYTYSDQVIPQLSKVLMEIDPSYMFAENKLKAWFSLRYFGKQYGNETNAFKWNPWWENFGGIDYYVSRNLTLKLQVVNFLDEKGVKGKVQGSTQIQSDADYIGKPITASAIRPRTIELKVDFKF